MRTVPVLVIAGLLAGSALVPVSAEAPRVVQLTGGDTLTYSLPAITAKPGELLKVVLRTMSMQPADQLSHNFVLLKPTVKVDTFIMSAAMAKGQGFIPAGLQNQIIVATSLAGAGEKVEATFTAPKAPGRYPYVCTFPGHYNGGMKGVLTVK